MTHEDKYKIYEYVFIGGLERSSFYLHPPECSQDGKYEIVQLVEDQELPNPQELSLFLEFVKKT